MKCDYFKRYLSYTKCLQLKRVGFPQELRGEDMFYDTDKKELHRYPYSTYLDKSPKYVKCPNMEDLFYECVMLGSDGQMDIHLEGLYGEYSATKCVMELKSVDKKSGEEIDKILDDIPWYDAPNDPKMALTRMYISLKKEC